jgi:hypothetical protein
MKRLTLFASLLIILSSCVKPSYKKNEIVKSGEQSKEEPVLFDAPENQKLTADQQIMSALMAVPAEMREGAKVYGYGDSGEFMMLREGTNEFVCIADDPSKNGFQVVGYHVSLEPMMARGRELQAEGKTREEKEAIRAEEAESGKLELPKSPAALHIYYGKEAFYNEETKQVENAKYRYVVYIPYATQKTTGLSLAPNESSHPWLMFPGQYNAHIMITPEY